MGKSLNPLSVTEGKIGNVVYFKLKNSSDGQRQGAREYVANPSNPRTDSQLGQRCKMTTVTNCYRAFKSVIQRSFEGTEYGAKSYQRWSSMAMGQQFAGPWLLKGDRRPCPVLGVPMSIGSLPGVSVEAFGDGGLKTSLNVGATMPETIGELSTALLSSQDWLREGDQITICMISGGTLEQNLYFGNSLSFYINANNTSPVTTVGGVEMQVDGAKLVFEDTEWYPLAACIIISREGSHLRSTSYWGYNKMFEKAYVLDGDTSVLPSYKGTQRDRATDWPVDPNAQVPAGALPYTVKSGAAVQLLSLRVEDGWLCATGIMTATGTKVYDLRFKCSDVRSPHYNKWLTSYNTDTSTAPEDADNDNTIEYAVTSDATDAQLKLLNWLIANGVDERWLYLGD